MTQGTNSSNRKKPVTMTQRELTTTAHTTRSYPPSRTLAVRIAPDLHTNLGLLSRASGKTMPALVRDGIDAYVMSRMASPTLDDEIEESRARFSTKLEVLRCDDSETLLPESATNPTRSKDVQITFRASGLSFNRLSALAAIDDNTVADQIRRGLQEYTSDERTIKLLEFARDFCVPTAADNDVPLEQLEDTRSFADF